eukprot:gb/GFBE01063479.1/.p1 GENE.gb/GFBE01063479.1/~~gb/GFBE01063479.1/.p1  ORF type:complete len:519 (+),score=126.52 gb/GFBE01063479.1/:1-1557(+)
MKGPLMEGLWLFILIGAFAVIAGLAQTNVIYLLIGARSLIGLAGYLVMQIGLWFTENKWDEDGSTAWLEAAQGDKTQTPEELEAKFDGEAGAAKTVQVVPTDAATAKTEQVVIPQDKLKAAFPVPIGFLVGWWLWGISYIFPLDGTTNVNPTGFGIAACIISFFVSFVASIPMADAVMHRKDSQKKGLSLLFLLGWIALGFMSACDVTHQIGSTLDDLTRAYIFMLCMLGPVTIIYSQKILFGARKMGTKWEESGKPNFHPIVYNMGGPLFVWGWFYLWLGSCGLPGVASELNIYPDFGKPYIPLFLNIRTLISFTFGCAMVPVVRFLDYSHDEDGPWCGENSEGKVFGKWWLGTDGTYFGLFLESPWPFIISWVMYGFSAFWTFDNKLAFSPRALVLLMNCLAQGIDAGILIQSNLYAGNMKGKQIFSLPFVILFVGLAINVGFGWGWIALALSFPGAILIILGQKTVFGARKRGDYTMKNNGKANPYGEVRVYSWGEVFFMMGWILICWGEALPPK